MVFNRKMYEYDTERTYYNCEFINLDTAQVQEIENPATSNVEDILWLKMEIYVLVMEFIH